MLFHGLSVAAAMVINLLNYQIGLGELHLSYTHTHTHTHTCTMYTCQIICKLKILCVYMHMPFCVHCTVICKFWGATTISLSLRARAHTHTHTHTHTHMYIYMYTHTCTCTHTHSTLYCEQCDQVVVSPGVHVDLSVYLRCRSLEYVTVSVKVRDRDRERERSFQLLIFDY